MKKYVKFICGNSAKIIWIFSKKKKKKQTKTHSRHLQNRSVAIKIRGYAKKINDASKYFKLYICDVFKYQLISPNRFGLCILHRFCLNYFRSKPLFHQKPHPLDENNCIFQVPKDICLSYNPLHFLEE